MIYNIGDKFLVKNVLCEVRFVNQNKAWVAPVENDVDYLTGRFYQTCTTFDVLDEKGCDTSGNRAQAVHNKDCAAV